jgi:hypothetical protein
MHMIRSLKGLEVGEKFKNIGLNHFGQGSHKETEFNGIGGLIFEKIRDWKSV